MIKLIKTGKYNFFRDKNTGEIIYEYDPDNKDLEMIIKMEDGSILHIDSSEIKIEYGGQISFDYNGDKYTIDDGFRDIMISSGYIIMDDYDSRMELEKEKGVEIRKHIMDVTESALDSMKDIDLLSQAIVDETKNNKTICFSHGGFTFTVSIDIVNNIVNKNQQRKINKLAYYPFKKGMDKYGTLYLSIFAKRQDKNISANKKYDIASKFVEELISKMNDIDTDHQYHFESISITRRIYHI